MKSYVNSSRKDAVVKKSEMQKEIDAWRWVAAHNAKFVEALERPIIIARLSREYEYLYNHYKKNVGK